MGYSRNCVPCKRFCLSVEPIKELIASDPQCAGPILEEGINEHPTQTVGICIVNKNLEVVAVESVKSVSGGKPHKALIVLHNLCDLCLG
ncbi:MAG: hypothetical protein JWQ49_605 [Edaphobacter sp.]|nr:hypothetical protein [Edaphobacter sp.]